MPAHAVTDAPREPAWAALRHPLLQTAEVAALMQRLAPYEALSTPSCQETLHTMRTELLMSSVRASATQYAPVHEALLAAKQLLGMHRDVEVFVKTDPLVNACTIALPGKTPEIVINSRLVELMQPLELQAVFLHELSHLHFADGASAIAMKLLYTLEADGTDTHDAAAQADLQAFMRVRTGFELSADRVLLWAMQGQWDAILVMFAKLAGGVRGMEVEPKEFGRQMEELSVVDAQSYISSRMAKDPHPPILYRVLELINFKNSAEFRKLPPPRL